MTGLVSRWDVEKQDQGFPTRRAELGAFDRLAEFMHPPVLYQ